MLFRKKNSTFNLILKDNIKLFSFESHIILVHDDIFLDLINSNKSIIFFLKDIEKIHKKVIEIFSFLTTENINDINKTNFINNCIWSIKNKLVILEFETVKFEFSKAEFYKFIKGITFCIIHCLPITNDEKFSLNMLLLSSINIETINIDDQASLHHLLAFIVELKNKHQLEINPFNVIIYLNFYNNPLKIMKSFLSLIFPN